MNKDQEGPRNIKLVRYTHPGPRAWKDGLERSKSLPVREKRKGDGRLIDMLKSRSAKFHNITVGRGPTTTTSKGDHAIGTKHHEPFFLPTRTSNPLRTSQSTVQSINLNGALGAEHSTGPSFTASVKEMLMEHRSNFGSLHTQGDNAPQDISHDNNSPQRTDDLMQKELLQLQQKPTQRTDDLMQKELLQLQQKPTKRTDDLMQKELLQLQQKPTQSENSEELNSKPLEKETEDLTKRPSQIDQNQEQETTLAETSLKPGEANPAKASVWGPGERKDHDSRAPPQAGKGAQQHAGAKKPVEISSSSPAPEGTLLVQKEPQSLQLLPYMKRPESTRSNLLRLFSRVDEEMHGANSASNNRILKLLEGKTGQVDPPSDRPEDTRSLQGTVVAFEGELGAIEDSGRSKLQVVYLSDDDEIPPKKRKIVPPGSGVLKRASPRRLMPTLTDPSAEKRKNDREVAIDVLVKLKDKRTYERQIIAELVEKGVPEHRALEGNPGASVTNDVCSVNNYETSHAYYYQQLDKRSKLSWIPLHSAQTDNRQQPKEIWRNELQASLISCCVFFYSVEPSNLPEGQKRAMEHQITQLKRVLQTRFLVKLADSLDKKVDVVILYGQNEKLLSELVQKRLKKMPFRVWSLQRALDFLDDVDVDLEEWGIPRDAQDREPIVESPSDDTSGVPEQKSLTESEVDGESETLDDEDQYVQGLLQQASDALDERDSQLKAARRIILALSKNVMSKELQVTSLTGQLKDSQKKLQNQENLTEQYRLCMAQQELEMAQLRSQLSKQRLKRHKGNNNRVSEDR
ncbi:SIR4 (YDR227W) [Zygosaccharomyces parabailii]|nr:SIR4 (YDR227W) [Zygosaccharomyces parabailii]